MLNLLIAGVLLGFAWSLESIGYLFRIVGSTDGRASLGYTRHVQFATAARLGSFVALPILAYYVDIGSLLGDLLIVPMSAFSLSLIAMLLLTSNRRSSLLFMKLLFNKMEFGFRKKLDVIQLQETTELRDRKIVLLSTVSYSLAINAYFITMFLAVRFNPLRATILQSTPALSFIGTLIAVFYLDTKISNSLDENKSDCTAIFSLLEGRLLSNLIGFLVYTMWYVFS
jgi:hypothetical protein